MNNRDSLRKQIIDAMNAAPEPEQDYGAVEAMFDNHIMPVLDAAMKAGELLLHRAVVPQKPTEEAIIEWLEGVCRVITSVQLNEATVSKRELLTLLYKLRENAANALREAAAIKENGTLRGAVNIKP